MTLLIREVIGLVAGAVVWLGAVAALSLAVALAGRRESSLVPAFAGALAAAGLVHRFDAPLAATATIADRPLAIPWIVGGAIIGIVVAELTRRRRRRSPAAG